MKYKHDNHFIYIINPPFHDKDTIKERLSGVWFSNKKGKGWRFPKNVFVYRELYKFFKELKTDTEFVQDGVTASSDLEYWNSVKNRSEVQDTGLRPYQSADINYLTQRGSSLVLNEPRTGKTPTMIKTINALNTKKNIVICPSSLVFNWKKEFEKWYPDMVVFAINGTPKQRKTLYDDYTLISKSHNSVMIISKDTWKLDKKLPIGELVFDTAIVDEAHFLRNYKSAQSKALFELKANTKYALTGTPSVKHGSDVFGLLHFINPDAFPSYWQFVDRYWELDDNGWGKDLGDSKGYREDELLAIMNLNSVQRKRKEVMKWLPPVTNQVLPVVMEKKQVKLYDQLLDTFVASCEVDEVEVDTMNALVQLTRLRQLCLDPRLLGFSEVGTKTKALLEFAEDNTEPLVVMTTFSSYFDLIKPDLEKLGKRVGVIDGSIAKKNKMATAESFQKGEIDILLCNIIAAGTGFTLDRSDTVLFLDKDFSPANNEQAQDRIVPTTEDKIHPINVITLVCEGTVDEHVNNILDRKEDLTKLINKPELIIRGG